jgi:hypothetical protein
LVKICIALFRGYRDVIYPSYSEQRIEAACIVGISIDFIKAAGIHRFPFRTELFRLLALLVLRPVRERFGGCSFLIV